MSSVSTPYGPDSSRPINSTYAYVGAFVDELQRAGIQHVVICPGSRSTPLAMAFVAQPGIRPWMHVDERSAAFFGLGMAKRLGQPVALLCTSGTAAVNFMPAVVEAKLSHVPLLVLTADRPHELRDCGAPQAIDQNRLYGTYVKWFVDVALPEATNAALRYIRTIAGRAAALTSAVPAGPVQLNFPFREPLTPEPDLAPARVPNHGRPQGSPPHIHSTPTPTLQEPPPTLHDPIAWEGRPNNAPYVQVSDSPLAAPSTEKVSHLLDLMGAIRRGLIIAGPYDSPALADPLVQLAHRIGYPILADPLSQLRCGSHNHELIISSYDAFLRVDPFVESVAPELVIRFGAMLTAKSALLYLKRYASCPQVVIDGYGGWEEPTQLAAELIHADPVTFCQTLLAALEDHSVGASAKLAEQRRSLGIPVPRTGCCVSIPCPSPQRSEAERVSILRPQEDWIATWQLADQVTRQALQEAMQDFKPPFEGRIFSELANVLPDGTTLYVGNSMPVRDLDTFFWCSGYRLRLMGNRGANGIDGVISSALGVSAVSSQGEPTVLVVGDLSFFHDLNGLLAARLHQLNLTIVLVNNDGGGIFSFLPQAAYPEHFEQLFGTPIGLDFRLAVQMYGGHFQRVDTWEQFRKALSRGLDAGGLHVIEVPTERTSNVSMHRQLWQVVSKALANQGIGMTT
jgi:2-succinyl-5-enolpyruvyl-6-hydroxy-3-cyclohexene-1-carboxylate synthase